MLCVSNHWTSEYSAAMTTNFIPSNTYNFKVYPSAVLGADWDNVVVLGVLTYHAALNFADIDALHVNVYPHLPEGTPDRAEDFQYLLVRTSNGQQTVIAVQWIDASTIRQVTNTKIHVVINNAGSHNLEEVRAALYSNGFTDISLRVAN